MIKNLESLLSDILTEEEIQELKNGKEVIIKKLESFNNASEIVNNTYDIEVENYIVHPYPEFNLHDNWNEGKAPAETRLIATVVQEMGKMIKVDSVSYIQRIPWVGWLPKKSIKSMRKIS